MHVFANFLFWNIVLYSALKRLFNIQVFLDTRMYTGVQFGRRLMEMGDDLLDQYLESESE